ncbi:jmjC domain-containing protein [Naegleria gruberi]|uniref:JmjC domain-containing protein n=1 Tax=Naegleria gruberi TaxID=5762 RepID=D2UXN1_NAEGR|nr:jmjC domain-containing protein [Naegleria gruberi]EFC50662.1 jmjC domain-containing protein [Naegleria gruberi]|eukprot:XP_002683406.1 jmjC domain-containing protein [Naegleria gruberi strain NEG-M]
MCGKGVDKVKLDFNFDETITETIDKAKSVQQWLELGCSNFEQVETIDFSEATDDIIDLYLYKLGKPIVLTNALHALAEGAMERDLSILETDKKSFIDQYLKKQMSLFHLNYLRDVCGSYETSPRDNMTFDDESMSLKEYIDFVQSDKNIRAPDRRILYGKDIRCPDEWHEYLFKNPRFPERFKYKGGRDLLANTERKVQSINLMIYVGNSETFTPAHKDVCGALGHNIMVYADNERTHAIWCILKYEDLDLIRKFWQQNGAFLDDDNCFLPIHILAKAPFTVYLYEQKWGDLILLPPSSPHQVLNMGGKSIKVAWNTLSCLALPYSYEILDEYRRFGKSQVYRIKAVTYYSMISYTKKAQAFNSENISLEKDPKRFFNDFLILLRVFDDILFEESIDSPSFKDTIAKKLPEPRSSMHRRYCNHCKGDIFNRCFHAEEFEDGYDLCMDCVAEGRGYLYKDSLQLMEHITFEELKANFKTAKEEFLRFSLLSNRPTVNNMSDVEKLILCSRDANNTVSISTIAWNNLQMLKRDSYAEVFCHQCQTHKSDYLFSECSKCHLNYCNQCLWDRYALTLCGCKRVCNWVCPKCNDACNCKNCLRSRDVDCLEYSTNVLSRLDDIKEILPFSVGDVNGAKIDNKLSSVNDFQPKPIKQILESKRAKHLLDIADFPIETNLEDKKQIAQLGEYSQKKRKLIIVNKNPKRTKLKIIHNRNQDLQVGVCYTCKRSISTQIVFQSKVEKFKFYCDFCINKDSTLDKSNLIVFEYLCDSCKTTIIGVRFHHEPTSTDLCQRCYVSNSFPNALQEYEQTFGCGVSKSFEIKVPDYADLKQ